MQLDKRNFFHKNTPFLKHAELQIVNQEWVQLFFVAKMEYFS